MTEQEQVEQIKAVIKQYGPTVILGMILACIMLLCWHQWKNYETKQLSHASLIYDELLAAQAQDSTEVLTTDLNKLAKNYPRTSYNILALFISAQKDIVNGKFESAAKQYDAVIKNSRVSEFRSIAQLRLARVYLQLNQIDHALETLKNFHDKSFNGLAYEIKGDAYLANHNERKAKESYKKALMDLPKDEVTRKPIVQMKLDNLSTAADFSA
jgi:predicted negative regulator of RcsB-dependent stress response